MQLLGYYLAVQVNEQSAAAPYEATAKDVELILPLATEAYERRALRPMVEELSSGEVAYLRAMSEALDKDRLAKVADIARAIGLEQRSLSRTRAKLIDQGLIASPAYGRLMLCVPLLADYVLHASGEDASLRIARQRRV